MAHIWKGSEQCGDEHMHGVILVFNNNLTECKGRKLNSALTVQTQLNTAKLNYLFKLYFLKKCISPAVLHTNIFNKDLRQHVKTLIIC